MVKIIATVGTSLITNFRKEIEKNKDSMQNNRSNEYGDIRAILDYIKDKAFIEYKPLEDKIKKIKGMLVDFAGKSNSSCAEIKAFFLFRRRLKTPFSYIF